MDTIAALATAPGGALGVLRLSGPQARQAAAGFLRLPRASQALPARAAVFARAVDGEETIDQVVALYFPGPRSATGEDVVEISAHGSPAVLRRLLARALAGGCREARPGEFTQRAFLNGRLDLTQAEAVCDLIRARTDGSRRAALRQLEGGLSRAVERLKEPVLELLARAEACLDHPEEDLPAIAGEEAGALLAPCARAVSSLAASYARGRLLAEGARVCLVGRPNAGKSSLLNALLGRERAIVCPTPGTTRDTLEEQAELDGLAVVLIDTAGWRDGPLEPAERLGVERCETALASCDLGVLVVDGSRAEGEEDCRAHDRLRAAARRGGRPLLTVATKRDLPRFCALPAETRVSALTGEGLPELASAIAGRLRGREPAEAALVTSRRQHELLLRAEGELTAARAALAAFPRAWEDRVACHLREALAALDELLGRAAPDDVLELVFSRFCVGK